MMKIAEVRRYPVKGLRAEILESIALDIGAGVPMDRKYAFAHKNSKFDQQNPQWVPRRNFLVVAHSPLLASLSSSVDHKSNVLKIQTTEKLFSVNLKNYHGMDALNKYLSVYLQEYQPGPYQLVSVSEASLTDYPRPTVSLMNHASLQDLESKFGERVGLERFRGNIWFKGNNSWEEFDWIGTRLNINGVVLRPIERIVRCAAIETDSKSGLRDWPLLSFMNKTYNHTEFGVHAEVLSPGIISVGDSIEMVS